MSEVDPLEGFVPSDINVEDVKVVALTDEQLVELSKKIDESLKSALSVKDVLGVLSAVGKIAMQMGVASLAKDSLDGLMGG
jgi:hypothetical protein